MRHDGRKAGSIRPVEIKTNVFKHPEGSVVISFGDTTVICSATIEDRVPPFTGLRERLGDGRIQHAAASNEYP